MDNKYLEAKQILEITIQKLNNILDKAPCESFEDRKSYNVLTWVTEKIEDSISDLKYYNKPVKEGTLYKLPNGKYAIDSETYFSCGYPVEVWNEEDQEWQVGRVEYTGDNYYFYNHDGDNFELREDLRVRIRK